MSLANRTASAQASAAKDTANCKRIFASRDQQRPALLDILIGKLGGAVDRVAQCFDPGTRLPDHGLYELLIAQRVPWRFGHVQMHSRIDGAAATPTETMTSPIIAVHDHMRNNGPSNRFDGQLPSIRSDRLIGRVFQVLKN
jgi:hypothetical protein